MKQRRHRVVHYVMPENSKQHQGRAHAKLVREGKTVWQVRVYAVVMMNKSKLIRVHV